MTGSRELVENEHISRCVQYIVHKLVNYRHLHVIWLAEGWLSFSSIRWYQIRLFEWRKCATVAKTSKPSMYNMTDESDCEYTVTQITIKTNIRRTKIVMDRPSTAVTWWHRSDVLAFTENALARAGCSDKGGLDKDSQKKILQSNPPKSVFLAWMVRAAVTTQRIHITPL